MGHPRRAGGTPRPRTQGFVAMGGPGDGGHQSPQKVQGGLHLEPEGTDTEGWGQSPGQSDSQEAVAGQGEGPR